MSTNAAVQMAMFDAVLAALQEFVYVIDLSGRFLYANKPLLDLWQKTADEAFGKTFAELGYPPELVALHQSQMEQVIRTKQPIRGENAYTSIAGETGYYEYTFVPLFASDGSIEAIGGSTRDVTQQRKANEALCNKQRQLEDFVENATVGLHWVGPDGIILWANRCELELLGYSKEEYIGRHIAEFHADQQVIQDILTRLTRGETLINYSAKLRCKDGSIRHVLINSCVRFENGEFKNTQCFTRDITALKIAEEERAQLLESERAARAEAERASRMKDEFLATLSHELRTPLNAILGYAQLLRSGAVQADELSGALDVIERNARSQTRIIEDLLDMSRIISGKVRLDVQRVDLSQVIEAACDSVLPNAEAKGVSLTRVLDPLAGPVRGDPARLQQVVINLLTNAIKFTPRGGKVQVALERVNSHIEIVVSDTGEGMKPEFLPHVFDRFRQADASTTRRHGGLGIGLSIVKQLVELHGGNVRAKSPGLQKGSTFIVALPLSVTHQHSDERKVHPNVASSGSRACEEVDLTGVRVLVVDDEPDARSLVARILQLCHAEVITAGSVEEALALFNKHRPDAILSDIGMPERDGFDLIRTIRAMTPAAGGNVPAAALSAFARSEDRRMAMMSGFQTHVAKPVEPSELIAVVASLARRV